MNEKPQTLQQAIIYFSDKDIAHQYFVNMRWPAVWMIANAKNGISSCEIARALGVT